MYEPHDDDRPSAPDSPQSLGFEAEFDGVRRQVAPPEESLFDPDRYWQLNSGTD
jgi:hypothetical protein